MKLAFFFPGLCGVIFLWSSFTQENTATPTNQVWKTIIKDCPPKTCLKT